MDWGPWAEVFIYKQLSLPWPNPHFVKTKLSASQCSPNGDICWQYKHQLRAWPFNLVGFSIAMHGVDVKSPESPEQPGIRCFDQVRACAWANCAERVCLTGEYPLLMCDTVSIGLFCTLHCL